LISAANLRLHDYQFEVQTPTGRWRWTTRVDVTGSVPSYQIRDIVAPIGILRDSIPIPGTVVVAMGESITEVQQQFPPSILLGTSSLTFVVDEGRGYSSPQSTTVTNNGVFGSLLGTAISTSAAYVLATPTNVGNLAYNESGSFSVSVDSTTLLASGSPYSQTVTIADPAASNNPRTLPITITVRPKATISASPLTLTFNVTAPLTGPFPAVPSQTFTLQNTGPSGSVLGYQIQKLTNLSPWLTSFSPVTGSLNAAATQIITVAVAPPEGTLLGTYEEKLRITGYSTNSLVDVLVQLVVT
jgi:hypothetical protein